MIRPGLAGRVVRVAMIVLAAAVVVVATLLAWPWQGLDWPTSDERRIADLQRLAHAVNVFRAKHDVLPASLARLPRDPAAPVHTLDPVTNRPYEYRPLGPLAYELCARFDAALADEPRDFWWHDAGRHCFALETREAPKPKPPAEPAPAPAPAAPATPDPPASTDAPAGPPRETPPG